MVSDARRPGTRSPSSGTPDHVEEILGQWRSERPDLDPSPMGVFGRVARVSVRSRALLSQLVEQHGLTPASFDVMANLRRSGAPYRKTPSELAETSMLSSGGMTFRLDRLEADRYIKRVPSSEDRRVMYAELTPAGLELIDTVIEAHLDQEARMLQGLTPQERRQLGALLGKLEQSVIAFDAGRDGADGRTSG